jgi:hypothetical protein
MSEILPSWMERAMNGEYVEDYELCRYVWSNFNHALTEHEHALIAAATLEIKARHSRSEASAKRFRQMLGYFFDADVAAIADSGLGAFQQKCCDRLLRDFRSEIYVNRCDRCRRIVASPIACACGWCGQKWYVRRPEMIARATSSLYPNPK